MSWDLVLIVNGPSYQVVKSTWSSYNLETVVPGPRTCSYNFSQSQTIGDLNESLCSGVGSTMVWQSMILCKLSVIVMPFLNLMTNISILDLVMSVWDSVRTWQAAFLGASEPDPVLSWSVSTPGLPCLVLVSVTLRSQRSRGLGASRHSSHTVYRQTHTDL